MASVAAMIQVRLNGKNVELEEGITVVELLRRNKFTVWRAEDFRRVAAGINNQYCPLIKVVEINGEICSLVMHGNRPVRDGMTIDTQSEALKKVVTERLTCLRDKQECVLIRDLGEFVAAEAEATGLIELEKRAAWNFAPRQSGPSIYHDPNLCVRCKSCVDTCDNIQGVGALTFDEKEGVILDEEKCVRCGQCILSCPTGFRKTVNYVAELFNCRGCAYSRPLGAMREVDAVQDVLDALDDENKYVVVQFAPAVRATIGEEFGLSPGELVTERLYGALREIGFDKVWDTNFSADLTIMEEGHELLRRVAEGGVLPQFTSCSPGWIRYCETYQADLIPHLSSAKSPQQMFGAVAKTFAAETLKVDPRKMFVVSIMPCTAKKSEAAREEMNDAYRHWREKGSVAENEKFQDVDAVLTSREAVKLLKLKGIDLAKVQPAKPDQLLGDYTGAAPIFGRTGGVMEAALRTAYEVLANSPLENLEFEQLGTLEGVKTATVSVAGIELKVAVVHGLLNAKKVCDSIRAGGEFAGYHFIEFMACPGGCIGGGGQIIPTNTLVRRQRTGGLNRDDREHELRKSHDNPEVKNLYESFLGEPLGHLAHGLLHTEYRG